MKLLMTTDTVGGVWTYAVELVQALEARRVDVALATMGAPLSRDQRAQVEELSNAEVVESHYRLEWMQDPWDDVTDAGRWLQDVAAAVQPDLVHLNNYAHGALDWDVPLLMVGHSCVLSWHEAVRGRLGGPEWDHYRREVAQGLRAADLVVAPTRAMLGSLCRHYGPFANACVIPNGRGMKLVPASRKDPIILAAGRLWDEAKNVSALARVARRLDWPVHVAGEERHPDGGQAFLPGVRLLGRLSSSAMEERFARSAIFAHPARYEPFGLTPLEAALAGCALVLGNIPSLREVWGDAAWFVSCDDEDGLVEALNTLSARPALRRDYAARARRRALNLTPAHMAANYLAVYRYLLRQRTLASVSNGDEHAEELQSEW